MPGVATLKKLESVKAPKVQQFFASEDDAIELLHPSMLNFAIGLCLEFRVNCVLESQTYLPQLMGLALGFFVKFWSDSESVIQMKLLR